MDEKVVTFNSFKLFHQQEQVGVFPNEIRECWRGQDRLN